MQRLQAFKYELMPNGQQHRDMRRFAGSCRFVFNKALAMQKERFEAGEKKLGYAGLCKLLTEWRNGTETPWLKDAPVHPLQQTLKDLERAYANFFAKRANYPRFKKKGQSDNFRYPDSQQIKLDQANRRLFLPKLGWLRYRNSRDVLGTVKQVTVSQSVGKWFVSIQTEREVEQPRHESGSMIGLDVGVAKFATLSDGLEYKQLWNGGWVIVVPPQNTSRTCPACRYVAKENRKTQAHFECVKCGYSENADLNAARNILAAGHAVLACGESVQSGRSMKQEPAEVSQPAFG